MDPYWALVSADQARYRRRSEGFRLRAPRSFRAIVRDEGNCRAGEFGDMLTLTDDIFQFFPVMVFKFLVGHSQELVVQRGKIESWHLRHDKF